MTVVTTQAPRSSAPALPDDYLERVYAGVLGKIIGVYLGRPIENWSYDAIRRELGDIDYYVHERLNVPLIVADDDITGTFTFVRAMPDHGNPRDLTPEQIGHTWLNYIIENRTILWWGGMGKSTEHTAYLRLKHGVSAPRSGSMQLNTKVVAEQIGAQIFIDAWAMIAPGDPELAADFARRAASVSHDGEAIYGAQVVAAIESLAFVESDLDTLIDRALTLIPGNCVIRRMIDDLRRWRREEPDWRKARERLVGSYGYDRFGGGCHMVPNHGLIILALLWGDDDFQTSMRIVNTCGWDTDCNAANVGCILGIKNGLAGLDAGPDFRTPVRDRVLLPTADGGRCISDAVQEAQRLVDVGRALRGLPPMALKGGARFHFDLPGSLQGFVADAAPEAAGVARIGNSVGHSASGSRNLTLHLSHLAPGRVARVSTPTFATPEQLGRGGYTVIASPTLYPGQTLTAELQACSKNPFPLTASLMVRAFGADERLVLHASDPTVLAPGERAMLAWRVPPLDGQPIAEVGVELTSERGMSGRVYLDYLTWRGEPNVTLSKPPHSGCLWQRAWVDATDQCVFGGDEVRVIGNERRAMLIQGTRDWRDYRLQAEVEPRMADVAGIAARVQGLQRYYAFVLRRGGDAALVKRLNTDRDLAVTSIGWQYAQPYDLRLEVSGNRLRGYVGDGLVLEAEDDDHPFDGGAVALISECGTTLFRSVGVRPVV